MKGKKIVSFLIAMIMLIASVPTSAALTTPQEAMQGYGNYPESVAIDSLSNAQGIGTATDYDSFKFSLKTSDTGNVRNRFTVLDRDAEGNYLVIAAIDFNPFPSWVYYSMNEDVNSSTEVSANVHYDPTVRGTLAHFLATDESGFFKSRSASNEYRLPTEIKPYILKNRTWTIEPEALDLPTEAQLATLSAEDRATYDTWLANRDTAQRTITADIVLPSYTELKHYASKIGRFVFPDNTVALSRSLYSSCIITDGTAQYRNRVYALRFNSDGTRTLERGRELRYKDNNYRYLPMFWLDKDFFKNVAVRIDDNRTGTGVIKQVKQYKASEISSLYTADEIKQMYALEDLIGNYSYDAVAGMGYNLASMGYPASTFSGYWNYPVHKAFTDRTLISGGAAPGGAPAANVFYVKDASGNDRSFVLLDRDAEGNYLVIVDEDYGNHAYSTLCDEGNLAATTLNESDWKFDTQNQKSIGYWLNHGFLTSGNGGKKLPQEIIDNLVEKDWDVEDNISANGNIPSTATGYNDYITLKNSKKGVTTVRGKVALPSRTEFATYKSKMSADDQLQKPSAGYAGYYTRTGATEAKVVDNTVTYTNYFYHICGSNVINGSPQTSVNLARDGNLTKDYAYFYPVRPIFWLDKDFFQNVAVNVSNVGVNVKNQITQYSESDLWNTYTKSQLKDLGYDIDDSWLGYGYYPTHNRLTNANNVSSTTPSGASPAENIFYVRDDNGNLRSFILLDRDANGNYLVMTEEEYGQHAYSNLSASELKSYETADSEWYFDPTNTNSIAYWLNSSNEGGFLENGNGGKVLPTAVVNKILVRDWSIENTFVSGADAIEDAWSSGDITIDEYDEFDIWNSNKSDLRTVRARISLPSRTEYEVYKDKIGAPSYRASTNWAGAMSRTANSRVYLDDNYNIVFENRFYHICGSNGNNQAYVSMPASGNMTDDYAIGAYYVRPIFWLSSDFFETVPVEINENSTNVINQIKQYQIEDLQAAGYTNEQLTIVFGLDEAYIGGISIVDSQSNPLNNLNGETTVGAKVTVAGGTLDVTKTFIIVVYNENNKMVGYLIDDLEILADSESQEVTKFLTLQNPCGAFYKCKAMIWDDLVNMQPVRYNEL